MYTHTYKCNYHISLGHKGFFFLNQREKKDLNCCLVKRHTAKMICLNILNNFPKLSKHLSPYDKLRKFYEYSS